MDIFVKACIIIRCPQLVVNAVVQCSSVSVTRYSLVPICNLPHKLGGSVVLHWNLHPINNQLCVFCLEIR